MSLKKNLFLVLIGVLFSIVNIAIEPSDTLAGQIITKDSIVIQDDNPVLLALDMALTDEYFNFYGLVTDTNVLDQIGYCPDSVPSFTDDYYANFLKRLDQETPFDLAYNSKVQAFIDLYVKKRRVLTSKMLGLQSTYFPMFEALLDKYELPLEFKYLAIVESALNPKARSRAGAVGLWQFMYATGKMYGLQVTSYTDDRMDPYKSTEAACKYFKY